MKIDHRDIISVSEASKKGMSWLVSEAERGRTMLVMRNSEPAAIVTNVEALERLEAIDEVTENMKLMTLVVAREATDTGARHSLDDVVAELGIDEGDDD
jgi:PHD/YefM family antitoxin component YafN of YafNO toxin-antitoxin module